MALDDLMRRMEGPFVLDSDMPALPPWFHKYQRHDKYNSVHHRPMSAIVLLNTSSELQAFGEFDAGSCVRLVAQTFTFCTTLSLKLRENHSTVENPWDRHTALTTEIPGRSRRFKNRDPRLYPPGFVEDELLFNLDAALEYRFTICGPGRLPHAIRERLEQRQTIIDPNIEHAVFTYTSRKESPPVRIYGQAHTFSHGSEPYQFFAAIGDRSSTFTVICEMREGMRNADSRRLLYELINDIRTRSRDGLPRDDFWFTRNEDYAPGESWPFVRYLEEHARHLAIPPWLISETGESSFIYHTTDKLERRAFATMSMYQHHFSAALLYERADKHAREEAVFNLNRYHQVKFECLNENKQEFLIHVLVNFKGTKESETISLGSSSIVVCFPDRLDELNHLAFQNWDTLCRIHPITEEGYTFTLHARVPAHVIGNIPIHSADLTAVVLPDFQDLDMHRKLRSMQLLARKGMGRSTRTYMEHGKARAKFEIASIIAEQLLGVFSPNFRSTGDSNQFSLADASRAVDLMMENMELTPTQTQFVDSCVVAGVQSGVAVLEGLPGTGKTGTLGALLAFLLTLGVTTVGTGHSHAAVNELCSALRNFVAQHRRLVPGLQNALQRVVRLYRPSLERMWIEDLVCPDPQCEIPADSMAKAIMRYVLNNAGDPDAAVFRYHWDIRAVGHGISRPQEWKDAIHAVKRKVLENMVVVFANTFEASDLDSFDYSARVIIIDEAGQLTEPDAIAAICPQLSHLELLILSGDEMQLPPIVPSLRTRKNPLANILELPLLSRLMTGYPNIEKVSLVENFRSHPSLLSMPSEVFYGGEMVAASGVDYTTPLFDQVATLLNGPAFPLAFDKPRLISDSAHLVFFDVETDVLQDPLSTSYCNPGGIEAIADFVLMLLEVGVSEDNIGVISTYRYDVKELRASLNRLGLGNVEANTVDSFQGRQKPIIILHFVAAFETASEGRWDPFGFVKNPQRLCVATTRAQSFMFMFGNMTCWLRNKSNNGKPDCSNKDVKDNNRVYTMVEYLQQHHAVMSWKDVRVPREAETPATE